MPRASLPVLSAMLLTLLSFTHARAADDVRNQNFSELHDVEIIDLRPRQEPNPAEWPRISYFVTVPEGQPGAGLHSGQVRGKARAAVKVKDPSRIYFGAAEPPAQAGQPHKVLFTLALHRGQSTNPPPSPVEPISPGLFRNVIGYNTRPDDQRWNEILVLVRDAVAPCHPEKIQGWYQVQQAAWGGDGQLDSLVVSFEQSCGGLAPVRGNAMVQTRPPPAQS